MANFKKAIENSKEYNSRVDRLAFRHKLDRDVLDEVCVALAMHGKKTRLQVLTAVEDKFDNNGMTNDELLQLREEIIKRERKTNSRYY